MTEAYLDGLATSANGEGYRRLRALFWFWGASEALTEAASVTGFSRPWLYELTHRAASSPRPPVRGLAGAVPVAAAGTARGEHLERGAGSQRDPAGLGVGGAAVQRGGGLEGPGHRSGAPIKVGKE